MDAAADFAAFAEILTANASWLASLGLGAAALGVLGFAKRGRRSTKRTRSSKPTKPKLSQSKAGSSAAATPAAFATLPAIKGDATALASPALSKPPTDQGEDRAVRVFISSTFIDMQTERDILVKRTFPALRARFRPRQIEVFEVDLRWGVTEEEVQKGQTIGVCLGEVDRCQPFFVALLGERYGSTLRAESLGDELIEAYPILARAAGKSLTEIEILHGVLERPGAGERALFFERDPNWLSTLDDKTRQKMEGEDELTRERLLDLKTRAKKAGAKFIRYERPEDIGPAVESALSALIEARFPEGEPLDEWAQEERLHAAYARERLGGVVGIQSYVQSLDQWAANPNRKPILVGGASGGGKSTVLANWARLYAERTPSGAIFTHFLGASPESADPARLARRLWRWLNLISGDLEATPDDRDLLLAALPAHLMRIAEIVEPRQLVIVLDGLDKLSAEESLGWLPIETPANVLLVVSSLPGLSQAAAEWREWESLDLKPLDLADRRSFIVERLKRWGKALAQRRLDQILVDPKAGNPLFLRTLLDELRFAGVEADLDGRLRHYLSADDTAGLFSLILARLEQELGQSFVEDAASLIWAGRAGLEEAEVLAITGASPLQWSVLRNALSEALRDQSGRITFSHDFLMGAVEARYLASEDRLRQAHLRIADRFADLPSGPRQREELPYQLFHGRDWARLERYLTDFSHFGDVFARGAGELMSYWTRLKANGSDPEAALLGAFAARAGNPDAWSKDDLELSVILVAFLSFAMFSGGSALQAFAEESVKASTRLLGPDHEETLKAVSHLGGIKGAIGDYRGAIATQMRVLDALSRVKGPDHVDIVDVLQKLAAMHGALGEYAPARDYLTRAFAISKDKRGEDHPLTWSVMEDAARLAHNEGDLDGARLIENEVIDRMLKSLNPSDPLVTGAMENLGAILKDFEKYDEAAKTFELALNNNSISYGPDHPLTLRSMMSLGGALLATGELARAKDLLEQAARRFTLIYGREHPMATVANENLAVALIADRQFDEAEEILTKNAALAGQMFGPDAPRTLTVLANLASVSLARGDWRAAVQKYQEVEAAQARALGPDHPDWITTMGLLAAAFAAGEDYASAAETTSRELKAIVETLGLEHPLAARTGRELARLRWRAGDRAGAVHAQRDLLNYLTQQFGEEDARTIEAARDLKEMEEAGKGGDAAG